MRKSFGYDCNVRGKADLAIYDEGKAKVLFEVKSTQNKAEFVKAPNKSSLLASVSVHNFNKKLKLKFILAFLPLFVLITPQNT